MTKNNNQSPQYNSVSLKIKMQSLLRIFCVQSRSPVTLRGTLAGGDQHCKSSQEFRLMHSGCHALWWFQTWGQRHTSVHKLYSWGLPWDPIPAAAMSDARASDSLIMRQLCRTGEKKTSPTIPSWNERGAQLIKMDAAHRVMQKNNTSCPYFLLSYIKTHVILNISVLQVKSGLKSGSARSRQQWAKTAKNKTAQFPRLAGLCTSSSTTIQTLVQQRLIAHEDSWKGHNYTKTSPKFCLNSYYNYWYKDSNNHKKMT